MADNRGGPREGKQGTFYPNRRDQRQPKLVPQGQPYGERKAIETRLSAAPLANKATQLPKNRVERDDFRGQIPGMATPSMRPEEPVTAGLPIGIGAGPEALALASPQSQELSVFRAIYQRHPNEDLRRLIEFMESDR